MNIPYKSPIEFDQWKEEINNKKDVLTYKYELFPTSLILNPETVSEIINEQKFDLKPTIRKPEFCGLDLLANPDLGRYEYHFGISFVK